MKFDEIFAKLDQETIRDDFLGKVSMELLAAIKPEIVNKSRKLQEVTLRVVDPHEILGNKKMRNKLIFALSRADAARLAQNMNVDAGGDVYAALEKLKIKRGNKSEQNLLDFFDVVSPESHFVCRPTVEKSKPAVKLFEHQREVVDDAIMHLDSNPHKVVIHMPTGAGKTRIAMKLVMRHLLKNEPTLVIWLAYSEELCEQAIEEFNKNWTAGGNRDLNVFRFFGKHAIDLNNSKLRDGLLVAGLSKMYRADTKYGNILFLPTLADLTTLIVMDEAHQAIAEKFNYVLQQLTEKPGTRMLLGLTATPGRTWGNLDVNQKLADFFGRQKSTLKKKNPIKFLINEGYLANTEIEMLEHKNKFTDKEKHDIMSELDIPEYIMQRLASDVQRSLSIILAIRKLIFEKHIRIIVFASTVEHAKALSAALILNGIESFYIASDTPTDIRAKQILRYKNDEDTPIVMCNFGVLTTGFDAPRTSAAVIARPTKSLVLYSQMIGRAMRGPKAGGNKKAKIISVVDIRLPGFDNIEKMFLNWEGVWND